jgi:iron complex transport system substrate-binding protein
MANRACPAAVDRRYRLIKRPANPRLQVCLVIFLLACGPGAWAGEIALDQADGSTLLLPAPATRVVTLSPHLAELVFAAGSGDHLVATVEFSNYPEAAENVPRIGDAYRLDSERILALRPDLVIAWDSGNPRAAIEQLRSFGVPVWAVEIREPFEIADTLDAIGLATGRESKAMRESESIRERLEKLTTQYRGAGKLSYFYQVGEKPLFTINGEQLISKGLRLCGGINVFGEEPGIAFQVGYESVIVANPDALFAPSSGGSEDPLSAWREWPAMKAVRRDALFLLSADAVSRATPRFLDALELACMLLDGLRE